MKKKATKKNLKDDLAEELTSAIEASADDKKLIQSFNIDKMPDVVKNNILDKNGGLRDFSRKFLLFFSQLERCFEVHFYKSVLECKATDTWDILADPRPYINVLCDTFMKEYDVQVRGKFNEKENENLNFIMPPKMLPLVYKRYVLNNILTLSKTILSLKDNEQIGYYFLFSGDTFSDPDTALAKLMEVIETFQKEIIRCHNEIQEEWQDLALDAYNNNMLSKGLMEFVMAESNKRKQDI